MPRVKKVENFQAKRLEVVLFQLFLMNLKLFSRWVQIKMHNVIRIHAWQIFVFHAFSMHHFSNSHLIYNHILAGKVLNLSN